MFRTRKYGIRKQYIISVLLIALTATICFLSTSFIGYQVVALILLLMVSILAMLFDIFPVMLAAILSAVIWNFFFIPPILTFHIGSPHDTLMFLMYFVIALINAALTFKIREFEEKVREKEEKEKSIKLYNTLLNSLSHELRTPISTIIGAIDTIKDNETKLSENNKKELYSEISTAGFRLNRQVANLLSMSRLEAGVLQPTLDWLDMNELIFSVIKNNSEDAVNHKISFSPNENLPLFKLDRGLVEQLLHNIVHNALLHTPKNSTIEIEARYLPDQTDNAGQCEISISDDGDGFPEDEIDFVFDKFYRLHNTATGGTGLGLSIAKGFAEAMGGVICLGNNPGNYGDKGGAKFVITIPAEISAITEHENE